SLALSPTPPPNQPPRGRKEGEDTSDTTPPPLQNSTFLNVLGTKLANAGRFMISPSILGIALATKYCLLKSMPTDLLPNPSETAQVVPEPTKQSSTVHGTTR